MHYRVRLSPPLCVSFVPLMSIIPPLAFGPCLGLAGVNRLGPCGFFRLVNCIVGVMKHMHLAIPAGVHCLRMDTGRPDVGLSSRWENAIKQLLHIRKSMSSAFRDS